jgi:hypothetical protein
MFKVIGLSATAWAIAAMSAAMSAGVPSTALSTRWLPHNEPGSMLLLATAFFGLASVMRRRVKGTRTGNPSARPAG